MIRIAIVEDDKQVQAQLADYIRRYERQFGRMFELSLFDDGDEIVSDYRAVYDIILLDVQMPVLDGHGAARAIRACPRPDAARIPIFAMTANAFAEDVAAAKAAGMNEHVAKPIDAEALYALLDAYFRGDKEE